MTDLEKVNQTKARLLAKSSYRFDDLREIVTLLRHEGGCPWDREQTHKTIRKGMIEECYEVVEAIDREDAALMREELGDVLLQILFHADIETDAGRFTVDDVANDECVKMITRHPHVFGNVSVADSGEVLQNWEKIKTEEKQRKTPAQQLTSIPPMLPALMRAQKVEKKIAGMQTPAEPADTADASLNEAIAAIQTLKTADGEAKNQALGQALQALCRAAFATGLEAEEALSSATETRIHAFLADSGELCT